MSGSHTPSNGPSHQPPGRRFPMSLLEESFIAFHIATAEEEAAWKRGNDPRVPRTGMAVESASPAKSPSSASSPETAPKSKLSKKAKGKKKAAAPPVPDDASSTRTTRSTTTPSSASTMPASAPLSRRATRSSRSALANDEDVDMVMSASMARELGRPSRLGSQGRQASVVGGTPRSTSIGFGAVEHMEEDLMEGAAVTIAEAKKNAKMQKRQVQKAKHAASSSVAPASGPDDDDAPMINV